MDDTSRTPAAVDQGIAQVREEWICDGSGPFREDSLKAGNKPQPEWGNMIVTRNIWSRRHQGQKLAARARGTRSCREVPSKAADPEWDALA